MDDTNVESPRTAAAAGCRSHQLSAAARAEIERLAARYPNRDALLLPALWIAQREFGWISEEAMRSVAAAVGVSPVRAYSVVTFYHMFHEHAPGRYNIQVCHNLSCSLRGAEKLLAHLHSKLGVGLDEPTPDGRFMIQRVECLGACEHAPVCQVNDDFRFEQSIETLDAEIDSLAKEDA